jgi:hypothetical protein
MHIASKVYWRIKFLAETDCRYVGNYLPTTTRFVWKMYLYRFIDTESGDVKNGDELCRAEVTAFSIP